MMRTCSPWDLLAAASGESLVYLLCCLFPSLFSLSVSLCLCLSVSVCLSASLCVWLCLSLSLSVCLCLSLSLRVLVFLSVDVFCSVLCLHFPEFCWVYFIFLYVAISVFLSAELSQCFCMLLSAELSQWLSMLPSLCFCLLSFLNVSVCCHLCVSVSWTFTMFLYVALSVFLSAEFSPCFCVLFLYGLWHKVYGICREMLRVSCYLTQLEELHIQHSVQTLTDCNKMGLVKAIWRNHRHQKSVSVSFTCFPASVTCVSGYWSVCRLHCEGVYPVSIVGAAM